MMLGIPEGGYHLIELPEDAAERERVRQERVDYLDELAIEEWKENR